MLLLVICRVCVCARSKVAIVEHIYLHSSPIKRIGYAIRVKPYVLIEFIGFFGFEIASMTAN